MPFRFLENIVTADVAFEATGATPEELFTSAAEALEETQVNTKQLGTDEQRRISLESGSLEDLLFDFLNELIFLKDTEGLAFVKQDIKIFPSSRGKKVPEPKAKGSYKDDTWRLEGRLLGEELDPARHELRTDVKAVAKHRFGIERMLKGFKATVVLDI